MIEIYPIEIEAVNEVGDPFFKLKSFDEYSATLTVDSLISPNNIEEFCDALRKALALLQLERSK